MPPVNEADLDWAETEHGDTAFRRKKLAAAAGGVDLGCSLYELPPGKRSWPYHFHTGNEEAIFVLSGTGTLRLGGEEHPIEPGDYATCTADDSGGHQVVNDGDEPLRYLMVSTMCDPDVTVYPEMEKVGVFAGSPPGSDEERVVHGYFRETDDVDYWE